MLNITRPLTLGLGGGGKYVAPIAPTNIYVDSVGGSNANNGLSSGAAKQTIAAIPLANNIIINLKRGSKWRETLSVDANSNVKVQDYGTGALPILDCSDQMPNSGWTQPDVGTYPNVWQLTVASGAALSTMFASMWVDDVRSKWVPSIATVNTTPGTFTLASGGNGQYGATTTTFQVNAATSPNSNGKKYEWAARNYGFIGNNGIAVYNLRTRRNAHNNGSFTAGSGAFVSGCIFEDGSKHNCYVSPGTMMVDCIAWKCDWQAAERDGWIGIVSHSTTLTGVETNTFIRCQVVVDKATLDASANGITGFYSHTDGSPGSLWGIITYQDCVTTYCQEGFTSGDGLGVNHVRSHTKACKIGLTLPSGDGAAVNTLTDCWLEEADSIMILRGVQSGTATTNIDGLRIWQAIGWNDGMIYGGNPTITRSAFARGTAPDGYFTFIRSDASTTISLSGCVLWGPNTGFGEQLLQLGALGAMDHNAYGGGNSDMAVASLNGGAQTKIGPYLTAAQAAGKESGSISQSSPTPFTNSAAGDFSLTVGSGLNTAVFGLARFPTYQTVLTGAAIAAM